MALNTRRYRMTKAQKAEYEELLNKYEPYPVEEIELDGKQDENRIKATLAKVFLENAEIID